MTDTPEIAAVADRLTFHLVALERWRLSRDVGNCHVVTNPSAADFARLKAEGFRLLDDVAARAGRPRRALVRRGPSPEGWHARWAWHDAGCGWHAVRYESTFERDAQPVLAFGGPPAWPSGRAHPAERPGTAHEAAVRRYGAVIALGQQVAARYPKATVTGYGRGGALAAAVALAADLAAYSFCPTPLRRDVLALYGIDEAAWGRKSDRVALFQPAEAPAADPSPEAPPGLPLRAPGAAPFDAAGSSWAAANATFVPTHCFNDPDDFDTRFEAQIAADAAWLRGQLGA